MSKEVQRKVYARLEAMADYACDTLELSVKREYKPGRNETSTHDSWKVVTAILERPDEAADELVPVNLTPDELAQKRQALRLKTHVG